MTGLVSAGSASSGAPSWNGGGVTWCGEQSPASAFQGPVHLYCFGVDHQEPVSFAPAMGRVAFHSQGFFDAALGLPGADAQCASEAEAHGLGGSYRALLSTSSAAASSRFDTSRARWVRTDGIPVVERAADLFSDVDGATVLAPPVGPDGLSNTSSPHAADTDSFYGIPSVIWAGSGRWTEPGGGMNDCQNWTSRGVDDFATLRLASETKLSGDGGDVFWNACLFRFTLWCLQE